MAEDGSVQSVNSWPLPKFYFEVKWDSQVISFQEVIGLDIQSEENKHRAGNSKIFPAVKMPGLVKSGTVTMKKGVLKGDHKLRDWLNQIETNSIKRVPVTISLLDESGSPAMVWTLTNAWPTKITSTDLQSEGHDEVCIESMEFVHEGLTISKKGAG